MVHQDISPFIYRETTIIPGNHSIGATSMPRLNIYNRKGGGKYLPRTQSTPGPDNSSNATIRPYPIPLHLAGEALRETMHGRFGENRNGGG